VRRQLANGGLTVEQYLEQAEDEEAEDEDAFWATIDERAEQALKAQVVLDVFADENKVDVSQQELTELIFRKAQQNRTSPQDEINHMMEHGHMQEWMQEVRRSKALAEIVAAASVTDADGNVVETALATDEAEEEAEEEAPAVEIIRPDAE
jgi:trigger factor